MAARAGAEARRDSLPLRESPDGGEGRVHRPDVARDGQGEGRGRGRRPGGDRHEPLHGGRRAPPARADDAVGAPGQVQHERADADRRRRRDHTLELPDRDPVLEDRSRARVREHGRVQAGHGHAAARAALRGVAGRGRFARGRHQHRARRRRRGRRSPRASSGRARHHADRLARDRRRGDAQRCGESEARPPRARRQERDHRA